MGARGIGKQVAVFGGTGHLGQELLAELIRTEGRVVRVFARPSGGLSGVQRAQRVVQRIGGDAATATVVCHEADLSRPDLGLSEASRRAVMACTDVVNCAADISFHLSIDQARLRNVATVANLLAVVEESAPFIHHVSTAYVGQGSGLVRPEPPDLSTEFRNPYERSKAEAESLLARSNADWRVYRPSIIVGSSRDGRANSYDTLYLFAQLLISGRMRLIPAQPGHRLDIVPSDFVARGICRLAEAGEPRRAYHLTAGSRSTDVQTLVSTFHQAVVKAGHDAAALSDPARLRFESAEWFEVLEHLPSGIAPRALRRFAQAIAVYQPFLTSGIGEFDPSETERLIGEQAPNFESYGRSVWRYALSTNFGRRRDSTIRVNRQAEMPAPASLLDLVGRQASSRPRATAIWWPEGEWTFAELYDQAIHQRDLLRRQGLGPSDRVGVLLGHHPSDVALVLGTIGIGGEVHLFDPTRPPDQSTWTVRPNDLGEGRVWVDPSGPGEGNRSSLVFATSGTTRAPKWIRHRYKSPVRCGAVVANEFDVSHRHRLALFLPLFHAYATGIAVPTAWSAGASIALVTSESGLLKAIDSSRATHVVGVMEHFQAMLGEVRAEPDLFASVDLSSWDVAICGDDPLAETVRERFEATFARPLAEAYGLTEGLLIGVGYQPGRRGEGTRLRLIDGATVQIRDPAGRPAETDQVGEVWIDSPWRMEGYGSDLDVPAGPIATGDVGSLDQHGMLKIIARDVDHLGVTELDPIGSGTLSAASVQDVLLRDPRISRVGVVWRDGRLYAVVVPASGAGEVPPVLRVDGRPVQVRVVEALPPTAVGKTSRRGLVALLP